jgi:hypothetical protein
MAGRSAAQGYGRAEWRNTVLRTDELDYVTSAQGRAGRPSVKPGHQMLEAHMGETGLSGPGAAGRKLAARDQTPWAYLPLSLCFVLPLATQQKAVAQDFHPTMVETGLVNTDSHVTFNPAFPNAPSVILSITRVLDATSGCAPAVKNVTKTGFDYISNCTAGFKYPSTWIATLQQ